MPAYNIGDINNFKKFAIKNLSKAPAEADYILFDCATCKKAFKTYIEVLDGEEKEKAQNIFDKCKHINEFLLEQNIEVPEIGEKAFYHTPCHLDCEDKSIELMQKMNIEVSPSEKRCCGSAGLFFVENVKISNAMAKKKANEIKNTNSNVIFTDCPLCRLGLIKSFIFNDFDKKIFNFAEIIVKKYKN
jgi:glycolate oxidase iron-sulfur subunit